MPAPGDKILLKQAEILVRGADMDHGRAERGLRKAVLAGDESAWRRWYDESFAALDAYVAWRCGGLRDLADEVIQETWLVAVNRVRDFDPALGTFLGWLCGIAANVVRNSLRQRVRARLRVRSLATDDPIAAPRLLEADDRGEHIARALDQLSERHERVLRAKYLEQRSVADIAAAWGETPKTIESLLTRARQAFRESFIRLE
jgi:RNA polymerase sigma-70 factor (ECF subfamily)